MKRIIDCTKSDTFHLDRTPSVEMFFRDARRYPLLSAKEQKELLIIAKTKQGKEAEEARKKLVECNQLFVASIAKKMNTNGNFLDIVNEGNIGLMMAIDAYDLSTNNAFISYAVHWIRKKINDYNANYTTMVRLKNANMIYTYARKARNSFFLRNERYPTLDELKDEIKRMSGVNVPDKYSLEQFTVNTISNERERDELDNRYGVNGNFMSDYDKMTSVNNVDDDSDKNDKSCMVTEMLSRLDDEKREIITRMYGIGSDIEENPTTIALQMGISVSTVKKLANEAIVEMRVRSKKMAI